MTIKGDGANEQANERAEQWSALADGELDGASLPALFAEWRDDASARARWHSYQLIGDVLRSEDLASTAAHDSSFMAALRLRLDAEPVVLAPSAMPTAAPERRSGAMPVAAVAGARRRAWLAPSAVAAGFVAVVASGLMYTRSPAPQPASAGMAAAPQAAAPVPVGLQPAGRDVNAEPPLMVANGSLIRDARLDRYLAAHQQWSGGSVIGGHAAFLRHVATDAGKR